MVALFSASTLHAATFTVTSSLDSGPGTLRTAINDANAAAGADRIEFDSAVTQVTLTAALPDITEQLVIDGTVGHTAGTYIDLNGASASITGNGLRIMAANCEVYGLYIHGFTAAGIKVESSGGLAIIGALGSGNVLSGNGGCGLQIETADDVAVAGNLLGLDTAGATAMANGTQGIFANASDGLEITGNTCSSNASHGIRIENSVLSVIKGNRVGTSAGGSSVGYGNGGHGISIVAGSATVDEAAAIGGLGVGEGNQVFGSAGHGIEVITGSTATLRGNRVGGSTNYGINLIGPGSVTLEGNVVGLTPDGFSALANQHGIVCAAPGSTIGGNTAAKRNVVAGNTGIGVAVTAAGCTVQGNYIGLDESGNVTVSNGSYGIESGQGTIIGGLGTGAGNVISGNSSHGVLISGSDNVQVLGNQIGVDSFGESARPNGGAGILANSDALNLLVQGNTVSCNNNHGIRIENSSGSVVKGNRVGLSLSGTFIGYGNGGHGISIPSNSAVSPTAIVGGLGVGEGNEVYGNAGQGIELITTTAVEVHGNRVGGHTNSPYNGIYINSGSSIVKGNVIGLDPAGTAARGNRFGLRLVTGGNAVVGGTAAGEGNVISGNTIDGVLVGASNIAFAGNLFGLNAAGTAPVLNTRNAISVISGTNVEFGAGNRFFTAADGAPIILDNVLLSNDALDADTGSNNRQNHPVLSAVSPGDTAVTGSIDTAAGASVTMRLYSSSNVATFGYGQGHNDLGSAVVVADGSGHATWSIPLGTPAVDGEYYSATATVSGSTSHMSRVVRAGTSEVPTVASVVRAVGETNPVTPPSTVNFDVTFSEAVGGIDATDFAPREAGLSGSAVAGVTRPFAKAANLATAGDGFQIPLASAPSLVDTDFTIEFWAKRTRVGVKESIIAIDNDLTLGFRADNYFSLDMGSSQVTSTVAIALTGEWQHWAVTYSEATGNRVVYLNGEVVGSDVTTFDFQVVDALQISDASAPFVGSLDEVRIWNSLRSQAQIKAAMHTPALGSESGLLALFHFDALSDLGVNADGADDVTDSSPAGRHADSVAAPALVDSEVPAATARVAVTVPAATNGTLGLNVLANGTIFDMTPLPLTAATTNGELFTIGTGTSVGEWQLLND